MIDRAAAAREWRQLEILSRDRIRAMLNAALFSRDADPVLFALWVGALVAAVPFVFASQQSFTYASLRGADAKTVEFVLFGHRLFFVVYSMLAAALVTALTWEALFPSAEDVDVLGALPVRPRTISAAYLRAAVSAGGLFCVATTLPGAFMFALVSGTVSGVLAVPRAFMAHVASTAAASTWVILTLLTIRGVVSIAAGARTSLRLGTVLQLMTIVALIGTLFFLPGVLMRLGPAMLFGLEVPAAAVPILWFVALYSWLVGAPFPFLADDALAGVGGLAIAALAVSAVYLLSADLVRRRAVLVRERARANRLTSVVRAIAAALLRPRVARAIFVFTAVSLSRSRRHGLILATHLGLAFAVLLITLLVTVIRRGALPDGPAVSLASLPLTLMFFLVVGLRSAFSVPTELEANWTFRLLDPGARIARTATRASLLVLGVVPALLLTLAGGPAVGWSAWAIAHLLLLQIVAGVLLVECVLSGWTRTPFACAHAADPETVRTRWLVGFVVFLVFALAGGALHILALGSWRRTGVYIVAALAVIAIVRLSRRRLDPVTVLEFDVATHGPQTLGLSEASR